MLGGGGRGGGGIEGEGRGSGSGLREVHARLIISVATG